MKKMSIISYPHVHIQIMNITHAKFEKDRNKIAGGVALTKYPIIASEMAKIDLVKKKGDKDQETMQSSTTPDPVYHMGK